MLWSLPWETPSGGFLHSGAQTGVAPGVTVNHECLHQSRFDSERSHERKVKMLKLKRKARSTHFGSVTQR